MLEELTDPQAWQQLRGGVLLLLSLLALLSWLSIVVHAIRIPLNALRGSRPKARGLRAWIKPDSFRDWMLLNPLNVVLFSDMLTPKGLVLRRRLVISAGVFIGCVALIMLLATPVSRP